MDGKLTTNGVLQGILSSKVGVLSGLINHGDAIIAVTICGSSSTKKIYIKKNGT